MKRNTLTLVVGGLLILIFLLLLFTFQVRQTEVAVVTTFDRPTGFIEKPGLYWKWPVPVQKVYPFDKRIHNFEGKFEETLTQDNYNLLVLVYAGWTIQNPQIFFNSFPKGTAGEAEPKLEGLIRTAKNAIVGKHPFAHFVSTQEKELKLEAIEEEILAATKSAALRNYGIDIHFVRIKRLGLPESVTQKVFDRMQAERKREVERLNGEGDSEAMTIRSAADLKRDEILAQAAAVATQIRGQAEKEAAESYGVFNQDPDLANFLQELDTLKEALKDRATLILDQRTSPFNLLTQQPSLAQPGIPGTGVQPDKRTTNLGGARDEATEVAMLLKEISQLKEELKQKGSAEVAASREVSLPGVQLKGEGSSSQQLSQPGRARETTSK